ncbi:FadR/GntR family transcriptional regulator [Verminephrobacter eiseniae]|uniref:Transcriptional regulator, GntR family n=1 Tax=Verminephrobacter eiseniae (strain EF01-2) TaxID=391735 RepID=A1WI44_VEREI|nr:FadR/GntR family transcriptional regulator [Verminephrobacter eiseniae]ABM57301.1 transcriptional regulator, GntR family [Verminephrobacter eiseniae EF01-2]MCW5262487.1 FadR family transcriptional regulator [Verminephrobacter eiseniae]MCW5282928.1 FadR family transcriptional regulator [Verminephrobacter eiseniae]MCW5303243.1 FadR family transcriptional regulator [Verminephrobacter eiseniae]MCW8180396.1 FadR family transcriptional regulator [Verminephrobacter eiseniae]
MPLQTVEPQRLYRQIAEQLRALIAQGAFDAGARLPAERDLAQRLGVSRPSVREALIALEVEDWVEVRIGSGVYVLDRARRPVASAEAVAPSGAVAPSEWGPLELIRARRVVEGETAAIAARCGKRKDVDAMSRAIASMHEQAERRVAPLDGDRAFHLAIAGASGNTVLVETVQGFWDSRQGPIFMRLGGYFETVTSWRVAIAEHEAIRDAIAAHDAGAARDAMHAHMDKSHRRFSVNWRRTKST